MEHVCVLETSNRKRIQFHKNYLSRYVFYRPARDGLINHRQKRRRQCSNWQLLCCFLSTYTPILFSGPLTDYFYFSNGLDGTSHFLFFNFQKNTRVINSDIRVLCCIFFSILYWSFGQKLLFFLYCTFVSSDSRV